MYFILYSSQAKGQPNSQEFAIILGQSLRNNPAKEITGLLLYHDGSFMQIIEGEKANVLALYETIRHDSRHEHVKTIVEGEQNGRKFPDWAMGFRAFTGGREITVPGYINLSDNTLIFEAGGPEAHPALALLKDFYANLPHN